MDKQFRINKDFTNFINVFKQQNLKINLISKNDESVLFEKHIYDSLAIKLTNISFNGKKILDIGCGGGFPCIPIAIEYEQADVTGIDSINKKINSINHIKEQLNITNLTTICDRVENLKEHKYDIITSRAVADLSKISNYALPLLKKDGIFIAYKSKKTEEEIENAKIILKKYNAKISDIIEYSLPLPEIYQRKLILITF